MEMTDADKILFCKVFFLVFALISRTDRNRLCGQVLLIVTS
jgi:hypothetical protein